jgi:lactate dehydrogenase-like 2-hydroxyacid dehydrogenase
LLGKTLHDGGEALRNSDFFEIHVSPAALRDAEILQDSLLTRLKTLDAEDRDQLLAKIPKHIAKYGPYQALVTRLSPKPYEPFDAELLSPFLPDLRIIVSAQCGYNDFDVDWMTNQGIWFCNSRNATCEATADMALFLVLGVLRNTSLAEQNLRNGLWRAGLGLGQDPSGMTLGIVGMGKTGSLLARKASMAFGMRVAYWNRSGRSVTAPPNLFYRRCDTLDDLLKCSDVVSLHCPLTEDTRGLMSRDKFNKMRDGSYFINSSRGALVDDEALVESLEAGKIRRAGLDVFDNEPVGIHPYFRSRPDKVVVQPHMGGLTEASFAKAATECFGNLRSYFETGRPWAAVNEVSCLDLRTVPRRTISGVTDDSVPLNLGTDVEHRKADRYETIRIAIM